MISKDELVKIVAQNCGVSVEISSFFFEVFVNRLSNKLKPGDLLHFHSHGFFHKRNCRIQLEKSPDSPIPKSYLIQLVIFSEEAKIKSDLSAIHFLKIANLKTLWVDDKDFQKSLAAGDFAPHSERNQLIKSFATKAEVIIAGLRKDYDSDLIEELIIPLTFDLNFLIKSGQKSKTSSKSISSRLPDTREDSPKTKTDVASVSKDKFEETKTIIKKNEIESAENSLPWNYGAKFLDKDKLAQSEKKQDVIEIDKKENPVIIKKDEELKKDPARKLGGFEPVSSRLAVTKDDKHVHSDIDTIKFSVSSINDSVDQNEENKFTEVKSKTDAFRYQSDKWKNKSGFGDKYSERKTREDSHGKFYRLRKNFLPIVTILAFLVIGAIVVYIYIIKGSPEDDRKLNVVQNVKPTSTVNIIERDYEFAVTYPYQKSDQQIEISGYDENLFLISDAQQIDNKVSKTETPVDSKLDTKPDKNIKSENKPVTEVKSQPPVEEKPVIEPEKKVEKINRIFLYKNFYVVYVASFKSEEAANREADRYYDLGYNAVVEVVERGRNPEYRLIVGDFTSEEFAKQFQQKYIK